MVKLRSKSQVQSQSQIKKGKMNLDSGLSLKSLYDALHYLLSTKNRPYDEVSGAAQF